jgi:hypothetical protein
MFRRGDFAAHPASVPLLTNRRTHVYLLKYVGETSFILLSLGWHVRIVWIFLGPGNRHVECK